VVYDQNRPDEPQRPSGEDRPARRRIGRSWGPPADEAPEVAEESRQGTGQAPEQYRFDPDRGRRHRYSEDPTGQVPNVPVEMAETGPMVPATRRPSPGEQFEPIPPAPQHPQGPQGFPNDQSQQHAQFAPPGVNQEYSAPPGANQEYSAPPGVNQEYSAPPVNQEYSPAPNSNQEYSAPHGPNQDRGGMPGADQDYSPPQQHPGYSAPPMPGDYAPQHPDQGPPQPNQAFAPPGANHEYRATPGVNQEYSAPPGPSAEYDNVPHQDQSAPAQQFYSAPQHPMPSAPPPQQFAAQEHLAPPGANQEFGSAPRQNQDFGASQEYSPAPNSSQEYSAPPAANPEFGQAPAAHQEYSAPPASTANHSAPAAANPEHSAPPVGQHLSAPPAPAAPQEIPAPPAAPASQERPPRTPAQHTGPNEVPPPPAAPTPNGPSGLRPNQISRSEQQTEQFPLVQPPPPVTEVSPAAVPSPPVTEQAPLRTPPRNRPPIAEPTPPATVEKDVNDPESARLVDAVRQVPGVRDAFHVTSPDGASSLRLELEDGVDPDEVHAVVSAVVNEQRAVEPGPQSSDEPGEEVHGQVEGPSTEVEVAHIGSVELRRVEIESAGLEAEVSVTLALGDSESTGKVAVPPIDWHIQHAAAAATVEALRPRLGRSEVRVEVEHASIVPTGPVKTAVVVILWLDGHSVRRLSGASVVTAERSRAVVSATLGALAGEVSH
jgi:hypothetical protein